MTFLPCPKVSLSERQFLPVTLKAGLRAAKKFDLISVCAHAFLRISIKIHLAFTGWQPGKICLLFSWT